MSEFWSRRGGLAALFVPAGRWMNPAPVPVPFFFVDLVNKSLN
jgi:hypothetical protein